MFNRIKNAGADSNMYIVAFEGHIVVAIIRDRKAFQRSFSDAFIDTGQGEGGQLCAYIRFPHLGEIVFFVPVIREVKFLGSKADTAG
jgi:hypothetical protein